MRCSEYTREEFFELMRETLQCYSRKPTLALCIPEKKEREITPCASTYHRVYVEALGMMTSSKFDLPQGTLDLLILRVVALGPIHGYAIAQRIQMISKEALQIQQGSLYPALHRLENKNFLVAEWGSDRNGPRSKVLSADGERPHSTQDRNRELGAPD